MIDWTKDVEVATLGHEDWEDFQPIHVNQDHVYGHLMRQDATQATVWNFSIVHFRNKPLEPKRVRGWVNVYPTGLSVMWPTIQVANEKAMDNRIACVYINVPEGYGLEERK